MAVIRTDQWLLEEYENPLMICKKMEKYFRDTDSEEIYHYLTMYGMDLNPFPEGKGMIKRWQKIKLWERVENETRSLQELWNGPNIPIFIFPTDPENLEIIMEQNGKAGLAFSDKLFLFISEDIEWNELRALLTHEYNHVCRLKCYEKQEDEYTLLDTVILEGLAELAVLERLGKDYVAKWIGYYSENEQEEMWRKYIYPNKQLTRNHFSYYNLLYGKRDYPKMMGYCVGNHLVKRYADKHKVTVDEIMHIPSTVIAMI